MAQKQEDDDKERRLALAQFLRTRRERISPGELGLPQGARRRTTGLRREEVAQCINVGVTWYTWLEQARAIQVSVEMLENLARVLQLDADERKHLFALARKPLPTQEPYRSELVRPVYQDLLSSLDPFPAHIRGKRWEVLAWNRSETLITDWSALPPTERNVIWNHFANPMLRGLLVDWEGDARKMLALFRMEQAEHLGEAWLTQLIERLTQSSPEFQMWWKQHEVLQKREEPMEFQHPELGHFFLERITLALKEEPHLTLRLLMPTSGTDSSKHLKTLFPSL